MIDYTAVTTSLITGGVTAFGTILGFISTTKAQKKKSIEDHLKATQELQNSIESKLDAHKKEYLEGFRQVNIAIQDNSSKMMELKHQSEMFAALTDQKISDLSERVERHNQVVDRTYALEKAVGVLENREKVSENRLHDLEEDNKK